MLSKETIVLEYMKCIQDPKYAITTYLRTFDKTQEGFVPFKLFPRQKEIVDACIKFPENIIAKPRQAGVSTTVAAFLATRAVFADPENPETILVIANKLKLAQKFLGAIKDFAIQYPRWIWGEEYYGSEKAEEKDILIKNSMIEFELPNKSKVIAVATSTDALRGYTPTYLVFDEAAFIDNGEEVYATAVSSLSTGGRCILISTPRGQDSLYYKTYEQAKAKQNNYNIVEMRWYEDPRYNKDLKWYKTVDEELIIEVEDEFTYESYQRRIDNGFKPRSSWYDDMCKKMNNDARRIAQELDVSFIGSGGNIIKDEYIEYHKKHNQKDPLYTSGEKHEYWIWEKPIEGHQYILAADVASGVGDDFSAIQIIDFTAMEQVMEYRGKIQPDLFAEIVYEYGNLYKAYSVVDNVGVGSTTVLKLVEMGYKYLHYDTPKTKLLRDYRSLQKFSQGEKIPGFNVSTSRLMMINHLEQMVRENSIKIRSKRVLSEMKTFVIRGGRPDHMKGYNDDCLMSLSMALWVLESHFKNLQKYDNQTKAMLSSWVMTNGTTDTNQSKTGYTPNKNNQRQNPYGDNLWLFSGMK